MTAADVRATVATRRRVLVARAEDQAGALVAALEAVGLDPVPVPTIAIEFVPGGGPLDEAAARLETFDWVVVTSVNGARAILAAAERVSTSLEAPAWAAIGPATRAILEAQGIEVDVQPRTSTSGELAHSIPARAGARVLLIRGDLAAGELPAELGAQGAEVSEIVAYRTLEAPASSRAILREAARDGMPEVVILTSGSSARGLLALAQAGGIDLRGMNAVSIGPVTADEATELGFHVVAVADATDATTLARTTAAVIGSTRETP